MESNKRYCVYKLTTPDGKAYIGLTCVKPEYRWDGGTKYKHQPVFFNAIMYYGWANIEKEILIDNLTYEDGIIAESEMIKKYDTTNPERGYNISKGVQYSGIELYERRKNCTPPTEEQALATKIKKSKSIKKSWENPEIRSKRIKGMCEKFKTQEYRQNVSKGLNRTLAENPELREQRSNTMKKRMEDKEYRDKCIANLESTRFKRMRMVMNIRTGETYKSIADAASSTSDSISKISKSARGITQKGVWKYVDRLETQ